MPNAKVQEEESKGTMAERKRRSYSRLRLWAGLVVPLFVVSTLWAAGIGVAGSSAAPAGASVPTPHLASAPAVVSTHPRSTVAVLGPHLVPNRAAARQSENVDPYDYYSSEPAPMGIADYGINGSSPQPHIYYTTSFIGKAQVSSLATSGPNEGTECSVSNANLSLQLNVVLFIELASGVTYYYWIQDVAVFHIVNPTEFDITYVNNIWNFSSTTAEMQSSTVSGNGSVQTDGYGDYWYADCAAGSLSGNGVLVTSPSTIQLQVNSITSAANQMEVIFSYYSTTTSSRVIYDNVVFPWTTGAPNGEFQVSGLQTTPFGLPEDAELVFGGGCCSAQAQDLKSQLSLSLEEYSAYGYEYVPAAFNFGSDTGETISNVISASSSSPTTEAVVTAGSGSLGQLYHSDYVEFYTPTKIPSSFVWGVNIDGTNLVSEITVSFAAGSDFVDAYVPDGTYSYSVNVPSGWIVSPASGQLTVSAYVLVTLTFSKVYEVTFTESGLTSGTCWSVTLAGQTIESCGTSLSFSEVNGTYSFTVLAPNGFAASPEFGSIPVKGGAVGQPEKFSFSVSEIGAPSSNCFGGAPCTDPPGGTTAGSGTTCVISSFSESRGAFMYVAINYLAGSDVISSVSDGGVDTFQYVGGEFANSQSVAIYDVLAEHGGTVTVTVTLSAAKFGSCVVGQLSAGTTVGVVGSGASIASGTSLSVTNSAAHEPSLLLAMIASTRYSGAWQLSSPSGAWWMVNQDLTGSDPGSNGNIILYNDTHSGTVTFSISTANSVSISGIVVELYTVPFGIDGYGAAGVVHGTSISVTLHMTYPGDLIVIYLASNLYFPYSPGVGCSGINDWSGWVLYDSPTTNGTYPTLGLEIGEATSTSDTVTCGSGSGTGNFVMVAFGVSGANLSGEWYLGGVFDGGTAGIVTSEGTGATPTDSLTTQYGLDMMISLWTVNAYEEYGEPTLGGVNYLNFQDFSSAGSSQGPFEEAAGLAVQPGTYQNSWVSQPSYGWTLSALGIRAANVNDWINWE